jgi:hypothetical protein
MMRQLTCLVVMVTMVLPVVALIPSQSLAQAQKVPMDPIHGLKPINVKADPVTFKGQPAVRVTDAAPAGTGDEGRLAILTDTEFQSGTIEVDPAGEVGPGAAGGARGFVGVAFRVAPD